MTTHGKPRIDPVPTEDYIGLAKELLGLEFDQKERIRNVARTWARHPDLMVAQHPLQVFFTHSSVLDNRLRELAVLRVGWRCGSRYVLSHHRILGLQAGLTQLDIAWITGSPNASVNSSDSLVLSAVDELLDGHQIADETWAAMSDHFDPRALIELISVVGRYWTVATFLNSLKVELEPHMEPFEMNRRD